MSVEQVRTQIGAGEWFVHRPDDAAYVHGRLLLRLDCSESNDRLRRYYRDRGFREVGRRDLGGGRWSVTLLEKTLDR